MIKREDKRHQGLNKSQTLEKYIFRFEKQPFMSYCSKCLNSTYTERGKTLVQEALELNKTEKKLKNVVIQKQQKSGNGSQFGSY